MAEYYLIFVMEACQFQRSWVRASLRPPDIHGNCFYQCPFNSKYDKKLL